MESSSFCDVNVKHQTISDVPRDLDGMVLLWILRSVRPLIEKSIIFIHPTTSFLNPYFQKREVVVSHTHAYIMNLCRCRENSRMYACISVKKEEKNTSEYERAHSDREVLLYAFLWTNVPCLRKFAEYD